MTETLASYLPQDRRQALATGSELPARTHGAALFADIAGFTPLTEALDRALGARRGAEEMTRQINRVYNALIAEVERYGGSVIGFAGDAITCWFNDGSWGLGDRSWGPSPSDDALIPNSQLPTPAAPRAVACALALQETMRQFVSIPLPDATAAALALKVAVASGPAHRLIVGDPAIQLLDVLAGPTLTRMAAGEHLAARGEVLIDEQTATALGDAIQVAEWRENLEGSARFAVLPTTDGSQTLSSFVLRPSSASAWVALDPAQLRPWLLPALYERHQAGLGAFLTELRPTVALFLRFAGIEYEHDPDAGAKLDAFIRRVQAILARYDGTLLQVTIGDKGSYLQAAFGAPTAHEDDPQRAARAALALLALPDELAFLPPLQAGISRGVLRVGAYGGTTRRTYGVMGDEVNLAARLMQWAGPSEALISGRVHAALAADFTLEPLEPIPLKGMPEPLPVFRLAGERMRAVRLNEPAYALPMVGRAAELAQIGTKLDLAMASHGQVVGIIAEAGMGKSRLLAEVIRLARRKGLRGFGGGCQSYGTNTPYLVWEPIWRAFFDLDPETPVRRQIRVLEGAVGDWAPERTAALPLLGPLLGLNLPENDFTKHLAPQHRKSALEALLRECLIAAAREAAEDGAGLLFVLEDLHWIDAASHDLLELVAKEIVELPVLIVLAYRPPELLRLQTPRVEALDHFTRVEPGLLTDAEAAQAIRAKVAQLWPERKGVASQDLVTRITEKAQGNPFYIEELLNYLRDRGIDPQDSTAIAALDLPASLHTLILSRVDQLSAQQQAELKVASVIGRLFRFAHLHGAYPILGQPEPLKADLAELARLDITPLDTPEPELAYLFKHIVTQEVAYASLTEEALAALHEQLAAYLEQLAGDETDRYVDLLAYHYDHSDNLAKKRYYLRRAGEAAAARYANDAAVDYLSRALELTPAVDLAERYVLLAARFQIDWLQRGHQASEEALPLMEELAAALDDDVRRAEVAYWQTWLGAVRGAETQRVATERAIALLEKAGSAQAPRMRAMEFLRQQEYAGAQAAGLEALRLAREQGGRELEAFALDTLAVIATFQGDYADAQSYYEQELRLVREAGDWLQEGVVLHNLGWAATNQGDYAGARAYLDAALRLVHLVGNRLLESNTRIEIGKLAHQLGDYAVMRAQLEAARRLAHETDFRAVESEALFYLGVLACNQGDAAAGQAHQEQALRLAREVGDQQLEGAALWGLGNAALAQGKLDAASRANTQSLALPRDPGLQGSIMDCLAGLARVALAQGDAAAARSHAEAILAHCATGNRVGTYEPLRAELTCYEVLRITDDPRARAIVESAYQRLQEQAAKIPDEPTRRMFLENVPYHRAIVAACETQGA